MAKAFLVGALALLLGPLAAAAFIGWGWWTYRRSEKSIVEKMDQYYLTVTSTGQAKYLLESDETFEIPYMASKLSVDAVPTRILDSEDRVIGEFSVERGLYVREPEDLPVFLKKALVASEDGNFYTHHGINWMATTRAVLTCIKNLRFSQGGSTITQQLAKMMFTTRKKTPGRKVFEMFCAHKLEQKFTKDQILLMYLNFAYFGHGAFGVEAASKYYFGKTTRELELAEAAMLVGIIPNPTRYSPYENLELSQARHRTTLTRMAKLGFIPQSAINRYSEEFWAKMAQRARAPSVSFWKMTRNEAPYVVEFVRRALRKDFTQERLLKGGLKIHTTFDLELQKAAEAALTASLAEENRAPAKPAKTGTLKGTPSLRSGEDAAPEPDGAPIEGSMAAMRPSDGAVLALVGGSGFDFQNQLIRAESHRPIGSCVKPFVWAAALESGKFKPGDKILDAPVTFTIGGNAKKWQPKNYGDKYFGEVSFELALHKSLNAPAIKILKETGVGPVIELLAKATGLPVEGFPRNLSLALGTADASVLDMARAYSLFVNGGRPITPYYIRYIEDREGTILRDERARPEPAAPILKPETTGAMLEIMRGVLGPDGTGHGAALRTGFNIPAAAKSGTTNDYRDAWFAGATPDVSAAVWMGHDDMRHSLGHGKAGGAIAGPPWMGFMKAAYRNRPTRPLDALVVPGNAGELTHR